MNTQNESGMRPEELAHLYELTSAGAAHAATAFSQLVGTEMLTRPPVLRPPDSPHGWSSGVLFEFEGCLEALVGIVFSEGMRDATARRMLGEPDGPLLRESIEAAIMELGNILVSRVASAIADTLGERLLPSIPALAFEHAGAQLRAWCDTRGSQSSPRIECEFVDEAGELGGMLVLIPDPSEKGG